MIQIQIIAVNFQKFRNDYNHTIYNTKCLSRMSLDVCRVFALSMLVPPTVSGCCCTFQLFIWCVLKCSSPMRHRVLILYVTYAHTRCILNILLRFPPLSWQTFRRVANLSHVGTVLVHSAVVNLHLRGYCFTSRSVEDVVSFLPSHLPSLSCVLFVKEHNDNVNFENCKPRSACLSMTSLFSSSHSSLPLFLILAILDVPETV